MINRKINQRLEEFYSDGGRYALLIDGARQVGKTFAVECFAKSHYEEFIEINFATMDGAKDIFVNIETAEDVLVRLSLFAKKRIIPGRTLVFFDEIQECAAAVTLVKPLVQDGRCHYILSGSLLGVELRDVRSEPVGFMDEVKMYPLDFEEFVLANGELPELIEAARTAWDDRKPLNDTAHRRLLKLFKLYLVIGGMPAVVQRYLDTKDLSQVIKEQRRILSLYRRDITKYDQANALRIRLVFDRMPQELNKKNKRYYVSDIREGERFENLGDEFVWLKEAGVAIPVFNVTEPVSPLTLAQKPNLFKLFANDVGLLAAQYMNGIQLRILNGEQDINFGSVYENAVAQEMIAHGIEPKYYCSPKHGELDFVLERDGEVLPVEVKSGKHYQRHRALGYVMSSKEYKINSGLVFNDDATKIENGVYYAPIYQVMFLAPKSLPEQMPYDLGEPLAASAML